MAGINRQAIAQVCQEKGLGPSITSAEFALIENEFGSIMIPEEREKWYNATTDRFASAETKEQALELLSDLRLFATEIATEAVRRHLEKKVPN